MNIALLMAINGYVGGSITKRLSIFCVFSLLMFGVLLTGSRSAFGGLVILFGLYYLKRELEGDTKDLRSVGIVALLSAGVYLYINPLLIRRIVLAVDVLLELPSQVQNPEYTPGFGDRLIWWKAALQTFEQMPLLGVGFNQFRAYHDFAGTPHNQYLKLLSETGLLGLGAFLLLKLWLIRLAVSADRAYFDASLYLLFYIISTACMGLFLDIENFRQMWLAIGAIIGLHEDSTADQ
jgi:O-antigen ligase